MSVPGLLAAHNAGEQTPKRPRGRPPGSKSKPKVAMPVGTPTAQVVPGQKRGRPRKSLTPVSAVARSPVRSPAAPPAMPAPEPKKRGRPRKNPIAPPAAPAAAAAAARSPAAAAATASPARADQLAAPVPRKRGRPPDPDKAARTASEATAAAAARADASGRPLGKRPVGRPRKNPSAQSPAGPSNGPITSPFPIAQLVSRSAGNQFGDPAAALSEPRPDPPPATKKSLSAGKPSKHARAAPANGTPGKRRKLAPATGTGTGTATKTGTGTGTAPGASPLSPRNPPSAGAGSSRQDAQTDARAADSAYSDDSDLEEEEEEEEEGARGDARRRPGGVFLEKHAEREPKLSRARLSGGRGRASLGADASPLPAPTPDGLGLPYANATLRAPGLGADLPAGPSVATLLDHRVATNVDYMGADVVRDEPQMDAVVKVFCTHTEPNYSLPWQRKRQNASTSSGFIIDGRRVLTNAHSVEHHTQVKLKKRGDDKKYVARVLAIGVECDLALLTVDDASFFDGVAPVRFGQLPGLQDSVTVVGYPIGGVAISVTSGVVSRIEVTAYSHGSSELLGLQIDAAINAGNSGGPAFNARGECVGVAFQSLKHDDAENIGYVIPSPVIVHFLQDYARNGRYTGFPTLGLEWQKLENPDMRKYLKVHEASEALARASGARPSSRDGGVYVRRVAPTSAAGKIIKPRDVLLTFDGVPIANDGTVPFRTGERISFHYLVSEKYVGERATITFARNGKTRVATLSLSSTPRLVPVHIDGAPPTYFIVAGLVFTVVCVPFLKSEYGKEYDYDAPVKLLDRMMHDHVTEKGQNVVVLAQVLASDATIGYEDIVNTCVLGFNGTPIKDLKQLAQMVEACAEECLRFELEHGLLVVLKRASAHKATRDVLETHCIPEAKSADLR